MGGGAGNHRRRQGNGVPDGINQTKDDPDVRQWQVGAFRITSIGRRNAKTKGKTMRGITNVRKVLLLTAMALTMLLTDGGQVPIETECHRIVAVASSERLTGRLQARQVPLRPNSGCTVFYASDGQVALGGNNEDYPIPFTKVWFLPPEGGRFGRVYFGFENFIWSGGMNDQGLFFDALGVDQPVKVPRNGKPVYQGTLADKAMAECATVECVVQLFADYNTLWDTWYHQFMFGDATGDSAIIEPLTVLRKQGQYQVVTNFYQSKTEPEHYTCPRYKTAVEMLESAEAISVDLFREILDEVHLEGGSPTVYSNIYDLKQRVVYLYHFHDYDNVVVLNLEEELAKGEHSYDLPSLFPRNEAAELWAQPIVENLELQRAERDTADVDPKIYQAYVGRYEVPAEMGIPHAFYSVVKDEDRLYLQVKIDKGWYELTPQSETSFFHLSCYDDFKVTFIPDESGQVTRFLYEAGEETYTFARMGTGPTPATVTRVVPTPTPSKLTPTLTTPTATTLPPTPTSTEPAATPASLTVTPAELKPESQPGQAERSAGWAWWFAPVLALAALAVWYGVRRWLSVRSGQST